VTDPIILNITLIQPSQPFWKDWLPVLVSIFIVILGYYVNIELERNKRQFESRKHAYNEFLDALTSVKCFLDKSKDHNIKSDPQEGYDLVNHNLSLATAKIRIFGSNKINCIVDKYYPKAFENAIYDILEKELIEAIKQEFSIREEAGTKGWSWRFWK
jgi:hypothetical protein